MAGHGAKLDHKKDEAVIALLNHRNIDEAAHAVGIVPQTLLHWKKDPEFETNYRETRRLAFRHSIARLQQASTAAATTLLG